MFEQAQGFYDTKELAQAWKISKARIGELRKYGLLGYIKVGRNYIHRKEDIDQFWHDYNGFDLSNANKMQIAKQIVDEKKKFDHR